MVRKYIIFTMMWQNLMSNTSLIYFICPITFLKEKDTSTSEQGLMLHQDIKSPGPLGLKNQAKLHLC